MALEAIGKVDDWQIDEGRELLVNGRVIAVFRTADGFLAVDGMCAHQGGPIAQGQLDGKCVTCPWHGWQYDLTDGTNLLSRKKMLDCFQVEIRDGGVWVDVA